MISRNIEVSAEDENLLRENMRGMGARMNSAASAAMVNRTHRVVQERAKSLQARRSKMRSLWIPLAVSGAMVAAIVMAIWSILGQDELIPTGLPDANQQLLVLMMWCLPVTVLLLAVVLYRRANAATDNGRAG
jgi:uncharacterized membrane protein YdbT with pleckstrin-like domain